MGQPHLKTESLHEEPSALIDSRFDLERAHTGSGVEEAVRVEDFEQEAGRNRRAADRNRSRFGYRNDPLCIHNDNRVGRRTSQPRAKIQVTVVSARAIESVHNGNGLEQLLDCSTVIVITTGDDYACAEIARRAEAAGLKVFVRTVEWEQQQLC